MNYIIVPPFEYSLNIYINDGSEKWKIDPVFTTEPNEKNCIKIEPYYEPDKVYLNVVGTNKLINLKDCGFLWKKE